MKDINIFWFLICVLLLSWATESWVQDDSDKKERAHYCEMVDLFTSSGGENGWPDYKMVYATQCAKVGR